jgi:proteasome accessory factor B
MPKEIFISRFSLIIKRLEKGPATYEQIAHYLKNESDIRDKNFIISKRTLQRDINDIYSQLNIEIANKKKR